MKEIEHNLKIYALILLVSAIFINLGIIEDFSDMVLYLTLFILFFTKRTFKKITNKKEEKHFLLIFLILVSLSIFLVKEKKIFNVPLEDIGIFMAALLSIVVMRIMEYVNRKKVAKSNNSDEKTL